MGMEIRYLIQDTAEQYKMLVNFLCDNSDSFYFVMRKELKYDLRNVACFDPYLIKSYEAKTWSNTITLSYPAKVNLYEVNEDTRKLLLSLGGKLYDWVAPQLPEDLTFIKNSFEWFVSTTHEEKAMFLLKSKYIKEMLLNSAIVTKIQE